MKLDSDFFENIFIYKCLTDSTYLSTVIDYTQPRYFNNRDIRVVYNIVKEFYDKHNQVPTSTEIRQYLTGDHKNAVVSVLGKIKDIDKQLNVEELYRNTEQFLKEKSVYYNLLDVAKDIETKSIDPSEILQRFDASCNINLNTDIGLDLYNDIDKVCEYLKGVESVIPSKWQWLDEQINGGFLKDGRSLYVFAGETNIGKSIFLGNVAANIASQDKTVLLVTLEMPEMLYAKRICANVAKIPLNTMHLETNTLKTIIEEHRGKKQGRILIKEFPPSTITPKQLQGFVKKIIDKGIKIDAIVIDYINLLHSPLGSNSYERIKYITEQLRSMSYPAIFGCPIISASQLGRSAFGQQNPGAETVSESIGMAQTADVIASIFQTPEDRELNIIRLGMMKNRFGPRGTTQAMKIDYETLSISQTDDVYEDDSIEQEMINTLAVFRGVE